jgi:membrane fusion protein
LTEISPASPVSPALLLYRPEAIAGLRSRHGSPARLFGVGTWAMVLFMVAVLICVSLFLVLSTFARKETVEGLLQPDSGVAAIRYSRAGTVKRLFVREGQYVAEGQPLMAITLDTVTDGGDTLGRRMLEANDRQNAQLQIQSIAADASSAAERREVAARISGARAQISHLADSLALQRQRLALGERTLESLSTLQQKGFVSAIRLRDKEAETLSLRQSMVETERQIDQARSDVASLSASAARLGPEAARGRAQLVAAEATLDEKRAQTDAERSVVLVAPNAGRVVTLRVSIGSAVAPGAALAAVLPQRARLLAELWVPSRAAGFVRRGDDVRLMLDAFPYQRFGIARGKVESISSTPVDPVDLPLQTERKEALYRIRVRLAEQTIGAYGKKWALSPGSRLKADLILERQSLMDWVLDPLRAVSKRAA